MARPCALCRLPVPQECCPGPAPAGLSTDQTGSRGLLVSRLGQRLPRAGDATAGDPAGPGQALRVRAALTPSGPRPLGSYPERLGAPALPCACQTSLVRAPCTHDSLHGSHSDRAVSPCPRRALDGVPRVLPRVPCRDSRGYERQASLPPTGCTPTLTGAVLEMGQPAPTGCTPSLTGAVSQPPGVSGSSSWGCGSLTQPAPLGAALHESLPHWTVCSSVAIGHLDTLVSWPVGPSAGLPAAVCRGPVGGPEVDWTSPGETLVPVWGQRLLSVPRTSDGLQGGEPGT